MRRFSLFSLYGDKQHFLRKRANMTENRNVSKRIVYLDALRVVSMFAVMVIHISATGYKEAVLGSVPWGICLLYGSITRFAVPVFVMISGAVHLDSAKEITMGSVLRKTGNTMVIFLTWSLLYALADTVGQFSLFSGDYFLAALQKTVTGHYHMWYLYMLVGLYLATPFLRPVVADRTLLKQFIVLAFLLNHCTRLLCAVPVIEKTAQTVIRSADLGLFSGYLGYYCLGYYLHTEEFLKRKVNTFALLSAMLMTAMIVASFFFDMKNIIFDEKMPHIFLYSTAVFLIFKSNAQKLEQPGKTRHLIGLLVPCSLGMYLLHPMGNFVLSRVGLYALTFDPLLCVPLCSVLVFAASFVVVSVIKKIPLFQKFV